MFFKTNNYQFNSNFNQYCWPIPNYYTISSPFGYRITPHSLASTYHQAIDIPAPPGTPIYSIKSGTIICAGWLGANGYCIKIKHDDNIESTYAHLDPTLHVKIGDYVESNYLIAYVGPKYVKSFDLRFVDSTGNTTNGATTGAHLHFAIKKNNQFINPLNISYINKP